MRFDIPFSSSHLLPGRGGGGGGGGMGGGGERDGSFEHPKLMGKKIFTILCQFFFLLIWTYEATHFTFDLVFINHGSGLDMFTLGFALVLRKGPSLEADT